MLGLRVDDFDAVAARLSTLDGEQTALGVDARGERVGPSQSGTFFGSFDPKMDARIAERHGKSKSGAPRPSATPTEVGAIEDLEPSDQRPLFFLVRRGEMTGPISPHELFERGRAGELDFGDLLCHRSTGEEYEVRRVKALCDALSDHADREQLASLRTVSQARQAPSNRGAASRDARTSLVAMGVDAAHHRGDAGWVRGRGLVPDPATLAGRIG